MRVLCVCFAACLVVAATSRADIFVLHDGGQVRGELVNKDESPRKSYHVKTATGGQVKLSADQVKSVEPQTATQLQYDRERWKYDDTVEDQWKLAEWCREQKLFKERKEHLEKILALDTNHVEARHALGYSEIGGKWAKEAEYMESQGYVKFKGRWMTRQEVDLINQAEKNELAEKEWIRKLKRWRGWLDESDRSAEGRKNILAIVDPYAGRALADALSTERVREVKLLYVEALAHVNMPNTLNVLVQASIDNPDEEVRIACLDKIVRARYSPAVAIYVQNLKSADNAVVNRAGAALASMKDSNSVGPLIDALITTHKFKIVPQNPGQISSTFGTGGTGGAAPGGFSFGQPKEKIVKKDLPNQAVLDALVTITGENFNFDVKAWKYWFVSQKKPATLDARRD